MAKDKAVKIKTALISVSDKDGLDLLANYLNSQQIKIISPQYKNHQWNVFPFLFSTVNVEIKLNWENSEFKWIKPTELVDYKTVPDLEKILSNLL